MAQLAAVHEDAVRVVAGALNLPEWLVEAVALEYLPCRRFVTDGHHVVYDFSLVTAEQVTALPRPRLVLNNVMLYHNVTRSVVTRRLLRGFVGSPLAAIPDRRLVLPEGRVSPNCGVLSWNPITAWDVKTGLDARAVVCDDDGLWQWEVREEEQVDYPDLGRPWYRSAVFGREAMTEQVRAHDEIQALLAEPYPAAAPGAAGLRARFEAAFARLEAVRARLWPRSWRTTGRARTNRTRRTRTRPTRR